MQWPG
ncbi:hypothetical protein YPPY09_0687, partial [Yersinia pestis PY-09]